MEKLRSRPHLHQPKSRAPNKATEKPAIKVKYISNPMMVKANNESEFRAIVQKLTGRDSADDAFESAPSAEELNLQVLDPPPSMAPPADPNDYYGSVSRDNVYAPVGLREGCFWRDEMEAFSGFQASCVNMW